MWVGWLDPRFVGWLLSFMTVNLIDDVYIHIWIPGGLFSRVGGISGV